MKNASILSLGFILVLHQVWVQAQDQGCNKTLGPEELNQVVGDWVLVLGIWDMSKAPSIDPMPNFTSSHMEIRLHDENRTLALHERNIYGGGKCAEYTLNMTLPQSDSMLRQLQMEGAMEFKDGERKPLNETATMDFLQSADNAMTMVYHSGNHGDYFLVYKREGHHRDVEVLKTDRVEHRTRAQCLGLSGDSFQEWSYDGTADFCHKKSAPLEKP